MTAHEAVIKVEQAATAAVLFGADPDRAYRDLAKLLHPDVVPDNIRARAKEAFLKLGTFHASLSAKPDSVTPTIIGKWVVGSPLGAHGDIADLFHATHMDRPDEKAVFKIARGPRDGDLIENENFSLKYLHDTKELQEYRKYIPPILGTLEASGRRANILSLSPNIPLSEILSLVPHLDFRHIVWMVNRTLSALAFAHLSGIVHGAILPEHLLFGPESHALTLVDWCYSVTGESKRHVPAIVKARKHLYPAEIGRKDPGMPSTDIYMLFATMRYSGVALPKRFKPMFDWCMAASPKARPRDAFAVQERWIGLAKDEYGPPAYLKLEIPKN